MDGGYNFCSGGFKLNGIMKEERAVKYKFTISVVGIVLTMAVILVLGCATNRISHTNRLPIPFELVSSKDAYISKAYAYEDGSELVVSGKVKRSAQNCCDPARGHVDIAVLGPEGNILDVTSTLYSPRNIPKVRSRASRFVVRLPYTLPEVAAIRLAHHSSRDLLNITAHVAGTLVCEQNMAIYLITKADLAATKKVLIHLD